MKYKAVLLTVVLTGLFILGGCNCACSGKICPISEEATASASEADSSVQ